MNEEPRASFSIHHSSFRIHHFLHSVFSNKISGVKRERVDRLLVERGFAPSRTRAQALVMAGRVLVGEQRVEKPSETFAPDAPLRVRGADDPASRYVGRGGLKLEKALDEFGVDVSGFACLDVGASTGGFTDCLLQHGARRVVAVDVGDRKSTRLNSSHIPLSRLPSSA